MADQWFVRRGEKQAGPMPGEQLRRLAASGKLKTSDHVRRDGEEKWFEAGRLMGLFPATDPGPPTPAPKPLVPVVERAQQPSTLDRSRELATKSAKIVAIVSGKTILATARGMVISASVVARTLRTRAARKRERRELAAEEPRPAVAPERPMAPQPIIQQHVHVNVVSQAAASANASARAGGCSGCGTGCFFVLLALLGLLIWLANRDRDTSPNPSQPPATSIISPPAESSPPETSTSNEPSDSTKKLPSPQRASEPKLTPPPAIAEFLARAEAYRPADINALVEQLRAARRPDLPKREKDTLVARLNAQLKAMRAGELLPIPPIPIPPTQGDIGSLERFKVEQVLSSDSAMVSIGDRWYLLRGVETKSFEEDETKRTRFALEVTGTQTYTTLLGTQRTVYVLAPFDVRELRPYLTDKQRTWLEAD